MPTRISAATRFREKYTIDTDTDCWLWHGHKDKAGYGMFQDKGKVRAAHIYSWLWAGNHEGKEGEVLDHLCRRVNCVNPAHLERVTIGENFRRGIRWTQPPQAGVCPAGHPLLPENSYVTVTSTGGLRFICKICTIARSKETQRKKKLQKQQHLLETTLATTSE